jgi:acyl-CoA synthetase (AMP-forming)/AMP-acid ligase II
MTTSPDSRTEAAFLDLPSMLADNAARQPGATALIDGERRFSHGELDAAMHRVAAALQRARLGPGDTVAIIAAASAEYLFVFFGALRAGLAVAPLAPGSTAAQLIDMLADCRACVVFVDAENAAALRGAPRQLPTEVQVVHLDGHAAGRADGGAAGDAKRSAGAAMAYEPWLAPAGTRAAPVAIDPAWPFNIIYSSGTTGTPKGIVQPHAMRWAHIRRGSTATAPTGYGPGAVTLTATPLYSNTTLVSVIPTLAWGGTVVLMKKFDAGAYLELAQRHRATHTMLVPVQYQRLMAHPAFDKFDLSSFVAKYCTSAPFHAELKAEVLRRWPGALTEYYGMTEGGGTVILQAHLHPTKLHTVGQPSEGHDVRLIDEAGRELPRAADVTGEVVGRSPGMMSGYHGQPQMTAQAEWFDAQGQRFIRTGDIGRFDEDGFLILTDRRKDMIISGGFNIFPSDLEAVLRRHPAVADASVFGVPSAQWGETPVAAVVLRPGSAAAQAPGRGPAPDASAAAPEALRAWANAQLGKTQRLSEVRVVAELPRSAIGKVLKRQLRQEWGAG